MVGLVLGVALAVKPPVRKPDPAKYQRCIHARLKDNRWKHTEEWCAERYGGGIYGSMCMSGACTEVPVSRGGSKK